MTSSYLKTSVFARPHEYDTSPFSKLSTLESVFENLRFRCPVPVPMDRSRIRRKKSPFSKIPGYVWTGSHTHAKFVVVLGQQCCVRLLKARLNGCNIAQHWQCWIVLGALVFKRSQHHQTCWIVTRAHVLVCDRMALGTRCHHAIVFVFLEKQNMAVQHFPKHSLDKQQNKWKFILL